MSHDMPPVIASCSNCRGPGRPGPFCPHCGVLNSRPDSGVVAASRRRRLGGLLLEVLLVLFTLGVGWLIWLANVAPRAQTPAKSILNMYVLRLDGTPATARRVWLREIGVKVLLFGVVSSLLGALGFVVWLTNAAWLLWDRNRQTLHDKIAETIVVSAPEGLEWRAPGTGPGNERLEQQLRELDRLRDTGMITGNEYDKRRRRLLE